MQILLTGTYLEVHGSAQGAVLLRSSVLTKMYRTPSSSFPLARAMSADFSGICAVTNDLNFVRVPGRWRESAA